MNEQEMRDVCKKLGVPVDATMGKGKIIDQIIRWKSARPC